MAPLSATIMGGIFFPMSYVCVRSWLARSWPQLTPADRAVLTENAVSSIQGVLASFAGATIVLNCSDDVIYNRHWLADWYGCFCLPYFWFDIWVMYQTGSAKAEGRLLWTTFLANRGIFVAHHVIVPAILFPATLLRRGIGDFFVGCFYLFEVSNPFTCFRQALTQLKMKETSLFYANGVLLIVTFFLCRVAIFPFMFWAYGRQYGLHWLHDVPYQIPLKCSLGCASVMTFQTYWFTKILQITYTTLFRAKKARHR